MYSHTGVRASRTAKTTWVLVAFLLCSIAAHAQLEIGDNLSMRGSGSLGFGYSGAFGNTVQSSHGFGLSGGGDFTGFYFHPNFLSFAVRPYYDRSQSNSDIQSITRGSGIGGSVNLFGGSHFPGSVSYGKDYSSNQELQFAGVPSVLGNSSSTGFGVTWSALIPNWPQLWANYSDTSASSSLLGTTNETQSVSRNLNLNSNYILKGFDLRGNLTHYGFSFDSPADLTGTAFSGSGAGTTYGISTQHKLPMSGSFGLGWSHATYGDQNGMQSGTTSYTGGAGFAPIRRLTINESVGYTTNLTAAFNQSVLGFGVAPVLRGDNDTNALYLITNAMLTIGRGWAATGTLSHRRQHYQQSDFSDTQYNGSVNYHFSSRFLGFMYFSFGMVDQANKAGNAGTGLTGNIGMAKKFGKWNSSADFNYSQAVQTLYSIATTSNYSYGGTVQRKLSPYTHWGASYRSSHSALTMAAGTGSGSESMSTNLSWKRYVFSGNYSQSNGTAIINSQGGLTPTPVGSIISPDFLYFNARSYGFNANGRFFQRLTVSGGYTMVSSGTQQPVLNTASSGSRYYVRTQYRLRHFSIDGGYDRATQEVSTLAGPPRVVNSFQLGIARWFNLF